MRLAPRGGMRLLQRVTFSDLMVGGAAVAVLVLALVRHFVRAHVELVLKQCRACGAHYGRSGWQRLAYLGMQDDGCGLHALELRNCSCGSTLSLRLCA